MLFNNKQDDIYIISYNKKNEYSNETKYIIYDGIKNK